MNARLETRTSIVLAACCAVLALLVLALWLGVGRGFGWGSGSGESVNLPSVAGVKEQSVKPPAFVRYAEIAQRPLFSNDRKPVAPDEDKSEEPPPPPVAPVNVILTGVVVTPHVKLAMLHDNVSNKDLTLREGMPLEDKQGAWVLTEIHSRHVVFQQSGEDEPSKVELQVAGTPGNPAIKLGGPSGSTSRGANVHRNGGNTRANAQKSSNANANLMKRIAARRKALREQAERLKRKRATQRQKNDGKPHNN